MEHIAVVYFSPAGGTRKTCLSLTIEMGRKVKGVGLCSLKGGYPFGPEDAVIVSMPVFGGRIPRYAAEKLIYLKDGKATAVTAAAYGNKTFEDALLKLDGCLETQGFRIETGTALLAEHFMVRDVVAGRSNGRDWKEVAGSVAKILEKLEGGSWQEPQVPGNCPYRDRKQIPVIPLTNASCISCGLYAARCPVQAVPMNNPSPTDQSRYILCMHCISVCPVGARSLSEQTRAILEQKLFSVRNIKRGGELFL